MSAHTVYIFKTPADFFEALLGARQHDAHVESRQRHNWLTDREAQSALASLAVMQCKDQIIADMRAKKQRAAFLQAAE